jgi:cytochrome b subunit of formate dehydrogenase
MASNVQKTEPIVIERYNWVERWTHTFHAIAMLVLIFTGLAIYFGWEFISFHNARLLHMYAVPVLLVTNWFLVPYGIISHGWQEGGAKGVIMHFYNHHVFNMEDYRRVKGMVLNFFGRQEEYPPYSIYNKATGHYKTRLHPLFKILIILEGIAIFLIVITGIVLYAPDWSFIGIPVSDWLLVIFGWFSPFLDMNALQFARWLHLALTYFFIVELILHAFLLQFSSKNFRHWRSIFIDGKEDLDSPVVQIIDEEEH